MKIFSEKKPTFREGKRRERSGGGGNKRINT